MIARDRIDRIAGIVLRRLIDLQELPDDQLYLCFDRKIAEEHKIKSPFRCGNPSWKGGGVVTVEFISGLPELFPGARYPDSAPVALRDLRPVEGEKW